MVLVTAFSLTTQCKTLFSFMSWVLLEERITVSFFFVLSWVLLEEWITLSFVVNNGDEKMEVRWMGGSLQPCTNSITGHKGQRDAQFLKRLDLQTASIAANNGYDPFHIAAKQGHLGMMGSLQGPVACPSVHRKQGGIYRVPAVNGSLTKAKTLRSGFWGSRGVYSHRIHIHGQPKSKTVTCTFSSSSNGNGSMAESFNENESDYIYSSVVESVEVKSGPDGFMIKMRDGRYLNCAHNSPQDGRWDMPTTSA